MFNTSQKLGERKTSRGQTWADSCLTLRLEQKFTSPYNNLAKQITLLANNQVGAQPFLLSLDVLILGLLVAVTRSRVATAAGPHDESKHE